MENQWGVVIDICYLSVFLGIGLYLKRKISFFQKFLIPTSLIAGFLGLFLGPELLNIARFDVARLNNIIYHLMAIGFTALALKDRSREETSESARTGALIVSTYLLQGILGFGLSIILMYTFLPSLFPTFGLLLPLSFGQGPGQAYSIGSQWENLGFIQGGNVGLSFATLGFLWACFGGIPLLNYLTYKNRGVAQDDHDKKTHGLIIEKEEEGELHLSESIDRLSIQIFLIGIIYLTAYLTMKGLTFALSGLGTFGQTLSQLIWGFHFIISTFYAILVRYLFDFYRKRKIIVRSYPNNYLLQRISGSSFDFMITASIAAISISTIRTYLFPLLLITSLGGLVTICYMMWICKKVYKSHVLEHVIAMYGMMTGTISTGLALLREVDPHFETPVAENLVLGSAAGLILGFPLMIILNIPIFGYVTNQPIMYLIAMGALIVYFGILYFMMTVKTKPKNPSSKK